MPELPEVETVRRDLAREVAGRTIVGVVVTGHRSVRREPPAAFAARVEGRTVATVGRRGKYLLLGLGPDATLVVHLRMSGQLLLAEPASPTARHTHVVLGLSGGAELRFVDPRTFGELYVVRPGHLAEDAPELAAMGVDPVEDRLTAAGLARVVGSTRRQLKALLMDQRRLAGIGNLYSDEILHAARLRHDRPAAALDPVEVRRLHRAMVRILGRAVELRGSSLADQQYVDLYGRPGGYQAEHRVYGREGRPCPRCATPIVRVRCQGRSTFFCPRCQR